MIVADLRSEPQFATVSKNRVAGICEKWDCAAERPGNTL